MFQQTQDTLLTLNNDLETQTKTNEELQWKLSDLQTQKENLTTKTKQLEVTLKENKEQADTLLLQKNDAKALLGNLKKDYDEIYSEWELKKKILQHQINELKEEQLKLKDEENKEIVAHQQSTEIFRTKIYQVENETQTTKEEIKKYDKLLSKLKEKEKFSMDTILNETNRFKEFLDNQLQLSKTNINL